MTTTLITGANRGIGLEFARQLKARGHTIIGTARDSADTTVLESYADRVETVDVGDADSVSALADRLNETTLDMLINNAGVFLDRSKSLDDIDVDTMLQTYRVNSVGPLLTTAALRGNLARGTNPRVIHISSAMGSIGLARERSARDSYAYRSSKSALNMHTVLMSEELREDGITCVAMHPGWVRTRMGTDAAALSVEESVASMLEAIDSLTPADTGTYANYDGTPLPA